MIAIFTAVFFLPLESQRFMTAVDASLACRQMEGVMEEIKSKFPDTVNVVFINVMEKENKAIVDYYGIATIPTQILLDRQGKAFYRHSEYLSADDTSIKFK